MKVGVIGLGVMGKNHARVLSNMPSVTELVLYDPLGADLGLVHGVQVESNIDSFLNQEMDYCVISSPTSTHLEMGLRLASRKIATLIEKPLASNEADGQKLVEAFFKAGVIAGVGHVERFNPAIMAMKEKLQAGVLGSVYQIATRRVGPYSGRIRDVGVVKDLASHDIDLVGWLSESNYESLNSRTLRPMGSEHEDILLAIGTLGNGSLVSHLVNWISPIKERVTSVLGENGMLVADTLSVDLYFIEKGSQPTNWDGISIFKGTSEGATHKFELVKNEPLVNEHLAFQSATRSNKTGGLATLEEGLEVLKVAERLVQG
jgi:UDP-N-acetylglucosamine 3-dehydrogenase